MPLLSIIIPVYNKEDYIEATIASILAQTFTDFELLLIDDGSSDHSVQRCVPYVALDHRVQLIRQANQGVSGARNTGLHRSTGTYIGFIDGDDVIEPAMYEVLLRNALHTQADVSVCGMKVFHASSTAQKTTRSQMQVFDRDAALSALLTGVLEWSANNKIYVAALAKSLAFEGRVNEDLDYVFRVLWQAKKVVFIDSPMYHYIKRANSVSMTKFNDTHMESITVSRKILITIQQHLPSHIEEARAMDFGTHISILNMLLLNTKENNQEHYYNICANLYEYKNLFNDLRHISPKQRYAYKIFLKSPIFYKILLLTYCCFLDSEVGRKNN